MRATWIPMVLLVGGAWIATSSSTAYAQPTACTNDSDCPGGCGGPVCSQATDLPHCLAVGLDPGTCGVDPEGGLLTQAAADRTCKCAGATCNLQNHSCTSQDGGARDAGVPGDAAASDGQAPSDGGVETGSPDGTLGDAAPMDATAADATSGSSSGSGGSVGSGVASGSTKGSGAASSGSGLGGAAGTSAPGDGGAGPGSNASSGCGCRLASSHGATWGIGFALAGGALAFSRRRRRK